MKIVTQYLWRGPRPRHYQDLKSKGFSGVISLQSGAEDALTESDLEHENAEKYGLRSVSIKCSNIFPPNWSEIVLFLIYVDEYASRDKKVYVHCHSGVDRTGYMIAVYRMKIQDWTFERAHKEWVREGRHWWFWWWKYSLKKWRGKYERTNSGDA